MRELIGELLEADYEKARFLVDTCFFIYELEEQRVDRLRAFFESGEGIMSSFNLEELVHVAKKLKPKIKEEIRKLLKEKVIRKVSVPVSPGDHDGERSYVESVDPQLLRLISDPSDAVLLAIAQEKGLSVITRDKHHLYRSVVNNYESENNLLSNNGGILIKNGL